MVMGTQELSIWIQAWGLYWLESNPKPELQGTSIFFIQILDPSPASLHLKLKTRNLNNPETNFSRIPRRFHCLGIKRFESLQFPVSVVAPATTGWACEDWSTRGRWTSWRGWWRWSSWSAARKGCLSAVGPGIKVKWYNEIILLWKI